MELQKRERRNTVQEKEKDDSIRIRIPSSLKAEFKDVCKRKAINSSELLRQFIVEWLQMHK